MTNLHEQFKTETIPKFARKKANTKRDMEQKNELFHRYKLENEPTKYENETHQIGVTPAETLFKKKQKLECDKLGM